MDKHEKKLNRTGKLAKTVYNNANDIVKREVGIEQPDGTVTTASQLGVVMAGVARERLLKRADRALDTVMMKVISRFENDGDMDAFNAHMSKIGIARQIIAATKLEINDIFEWGKLDGKNMKVLFENVMRYAAFTTEGAGGGGNGQRVTVNFLNLGAKPQQEKQKTGRKIIDKNARFLIPDSSERPSDMDE